MLSEQIIHFSKMHGLGNDMVVIDTLSQPCKLSPEHIAALANRHTGIGFDQLLMIEPSQQADFFCRIFNADGSEAEQCGNGLRCVGRFLHEKQLTRQPRLTIETRAGICQVIVHAPDRIEVAMGVPCFQPEHIPFVTTSRQPRYALSLTPDVPPVELSILSMGNPHAILRVTSTATSPVTELGSAIARHAAFPRSTNVGFMEVLSRDQIRLRTFERGVGETFACGSNACAAVVAGIQQDWLDSAVKVNLPQGELAIVWHGEDQSVFMTGPAALVYNGYFYR